jgi:hypothetical protein
MLLLSALLLGFMITRLRGHEHFWFVAWPGTVVHETLHYGVGRVLGAEPYDFNVMPSKADADGYRQLGSVSFTNITWFNAMPTALAPMLAPAVSMFILHHMDLELSWTSLGLLFLAASVASGSYPSRQDLAVAFRHPMGVIFWAGVAFFAMKYWA